MAFPFVNLAIALTSLSFGTEAFGRWLLIDLIWKLLVGLCMGYGIGRVLGYLTFHLPNVAKLSRTGDGFVALGAALFAYGLTQLAGGYGFLAVFVAALGLRHASRDHSYQHRLHEFAEETERLLMMMMLVLFGGMVMHAGLLARLDARIILFTSLTVLVARPLAGFISLSGSQIPRREKVVISFFGIRGMGTIYYLAFALNQADFPDPAKLWSIAALTVLVSILLHGVTVTPALQFLDKWQARPNADAGRPPSM